MIRAVILDAYGTIFDTGTGSVDAMTEILKRNGKTDLDPKCVYARFKMLHREHMNTLTEFMTEAEIYGLDMAQLHREYGLTEDPAEDTKIMLSIQGTRVAFPDSREGIGRMQRKVPVIIGSITDTWPLKADLERAGIVPDKIFTSESLKAYKPAVRFYRGILEAMDLRPEDTLFAGDSLVDDVWGPKRVGMKTCWITRKGERLREDDPRPDFIAEDLEKLAEIVNALEP